MRAKTASDAAFEKYLEASREYWDEYCAKDCAKEALFDECAPGDLYEKPIYLSDDESEEAAEVASLAPQPGPAPQPAGDTNTFASAFHSYLVGPSCFYAVNAPHDSY